MSLHYSVLAAVALVVSAAAQPPLTANVTGKLHEGNNLIVHGYAIELSNLATREVIDRIEVATDGEFRAMRVPHGEYMLRVTNYHGDALVTRFVTVNGMNSPIDIRLPEPPPVPTGGTISARELLHPPHKKALDATIAAQRFSQSGRYVDAATEYEKALRISPDFAVAHSNLGVQYLRLGRFDDAAVEIGRALEIAGPNAHDLTNLAYTQFKLGRFADAASNAQHALQLQPDAPNAQKILLAARQRLGEL